MQNSPASGHTPASFSIDSFDFGGSSSGGAAHNDFGIEDLNIFANLHSAPNTHSDSGSAPASHHPSPSTAAAHARSDALPSSHLHTNSPLSISRSPAPPSNNNEQQQQQQQSSQMDLNLSGFLQQHTASSSSSSSAHPSPSQQHHPKSQSQSQNGQQQQDPNLPQLSLADLQRMILEKERTDRIQNMQTALLKQQLEQLQRMSQQQQQQQQQQNPHHQHQQPPPLSIPPALQNQLASQISDMPQNQQQGLLSALQNVLNQAPVPQNGQPSWQQSANSADHPAALAQYGLMTPLGSGAFNNANCPPGQASFMSPLNMPVSSQQPGSTPSDAPHRGQDYIGSYTPLESPAVTPASVFSNASTGIVMHELFSPLTSPALGPQPHSMGDLMLPSAVSASSIHGQAQAMTASPAFGAVSSNTPTASPLALMAKSGSKIRKNRSTTAEARANKVRPSPLIKPVQAGRTKAKKDSISQMSPNGTNGASSSSGPSSRRQSITESAASHSRHQSIEANQSEETSSTPSPIDLGHGHMPPPSAPTSKPLTPGSIMGIRPSPSATLEPKRSTSLASALKGKTKAEDAHLQPQPQPQSQPQYANIAPFPASKVTFNLLPNPNGSAPGPAPGAGDPWLTYTKSPGGLESRRTSHKAAEQKRRDSLKFCFDELRGLLPAITLDEDAPGGSLLGPDGATDDQEAEQFNIADVGDPEMARSANKAISKVALLRHSNEYLVRLKKRLERRDAALEECRRRLAELEAKMDTS